MRGRRSDTELSVEKWVGPGTLYIQYRQHQSKPSIIHSPQNIVNCLSGPKSGPQVSIFPEVLLWLALFRLVKGKSTGGMDSQAQTLRILLSYY